MNILICRSEKGQKPYRKFNLKSFEMLAYLFIRRVSTKLVAHGCERIDLACKRFEFEIAT